MVVYCSSLDLCSKLFAHFNFELGEESFHPPAHLCEYRLFGIYHSDTGQHNKDVILQSQRGWSELCSRRLHWAWGSISGTSTVSFTIVPPTVSMFISRKVAGEDEVVLMLCPPFSGQSGSDARLQHQHPVKDSTYHIYCCTNNKYHHPMINGLLLCYM